ncbi:ABC transporter substrate-binding protein [Halomonas huangheensis]|nr:ABC transporter substrate-binding protein [Halomonas huangheensis]
MTPRTIALGGTLAAGMLVTGLTQASDTLLRTVGNFSGNKLHVEEVERPFFTELDAMDGLKVVYNPMDAIGVEAADALRLLRSGAFDVMSVQIGMASRDEPFFEGIDLAGVAADLETQREVVNAVREKFDERLQERFNAKVMTLWPFGPQMMFCNGDIESVDDLAGKKVRVFTPSMSRLVEGLGAIPVTLQFSEVYLALQRGVADCGVTAPSAGNNGKWPEVTDRFVPLPLAYSVQGHFMNLDTWNGLDETQQQELSEAFSRLDDQLWQLAHDVNDDAIACNTGQQSCSGHEAYDMQLVEIDPDSRRLVESIASEAVLPVWAETCSKQYAACVEDWNATVGEVTGLSIQ